MVNLPTFQSAGEFFAQFKQPDINAFTNPKVYAVALVVAIVASIETLLCIEATDRLDPYRRISPMNRELFAQGIGNAIAGLLGGLPMTSVIVRSSANIYAGAKTWVSSFTHGLLLLLAVILIPGILNQIPLSALAAVLFVVGYKLTRLGLFKEMYTAGFAQFIPFLVTVIAIVFTDLLKGVVLGLGVGIFIVIWSNYVSSITMVKDGNDVLLKFTKDVSFINKIKLKKLLLEMKPGTRVLIDGSLARFIDSDIIETIQEFRDGAKFKNIEVTLKGIENKQYPKRFKRLQAIWTQNTSVDKD